MLQICFYGAHAIFTGGWRWGLTQPEHAAYFWPTVHKSPTLFLPGYFLTLPDEIFLTRREKIEKFGIFRGHFPNPQAQTKDGWPEPTRAIKNWPDLTLVKNFNLVPAQLVTISVIIFHISCMTVRNFIPNLRSWFSVMWLFVGDIGWI